MEAQKDRKLEEGSSIPRMNYRGEIKILYRQNQNTFTVLKKPFSVSTENEFFTSKIVE